MDPTDEQHDAVRAFASGETLRINAFAGTGKTTTLKLISRSTVRNGLYLAFNRSLATEAAGSFPDTVSCHTVHQIAYRSTPEVFRKRREKMTGALNANAVVNLLQLKRLEISSKEALEPRSRASLVQQTLRRFCYSDNPAVHERHVPMIGRLPGLAEPQRQRVVADTVNLASALWQKMVDPTDATPLGHDGYLKLWALSRPVLATDYILLDEAQDTNDVVLGVLKAQACQTVYVGDAYQQIYQWRGAVNAMASLEGVPTTYLTQSFRFGATIAEGATGILKLLDEPRPLLGNPNIISQFGCSDPQTVLCRKNSTAIIEVIHALDAGRGVHIVGGPQDLLRLLRGVITLQRGMPCDVPEFFGFANWRQVLEFVEDGDGDDLAAFVSLVESTGAERLIDALEATESSEESAALLVSTAHKAKGREWDRVALTNDYLVVGEDGRDDPVNDEGNRKSRDDELRLIYVAMTRGRKEVQLPDAVATMLDIKQEARLSKPAPLSPPLPSGKATGELSEPVGPTSSPLPGPKGQDESPSNSSVYEWGFWILAVCALIMLVALVGHWIN